MLAKIGPGMNTSRRRPVSGSSWTMSVPVMSRGHEVGRELDAGELEVERLRHRVDEQGLGQSGHAHQQAVAAGEEADEDLLDDVVLADDDLAELSENPGVP